LTDFSATLSPPTPDSSTLNSNLSKLLPSRSKSLETPILYVEYEEKIFWFFGYGKKRFNFIIGFPIFSTKVFSMAVAAASPLHRPARHGGSGKGLQLALEESQTTLADVVHELWQEGRTVALGARWRACAFFFGIRTFDATATRIADPVVACRWGTAQRSPLVAAVPEQWRCGGCGCAVARAPCCFCAW
jgi:hypothetical protein